jgi:hypothetical protein
MVVLALTPMSRYHGEWPQHRSKTITHALLNIKVVPMPDNDLNHHDLEQRWEAILEGLEPLRPILERQGHVAAKRLAPGVGQFVLRFRTPAEDDPQRRVRRSINLGADSLLADRVRRLLRSWRWARRWRQLEAQEKRLFGVIASRSFDAVPSQQGWADTLGAQTADAVGSP